MKSLEELTNTEKGRLLGDLFPHEREGMLNYILATIQELKDSEEAVRREWGQEKVSPDLWYNIADDLRKLIGSMALDMKRSGKVFADQLFYGYRSIFVTVTLLNYARMANRNYKLSLAIELLFG